MLRVELVCMVERGVEGTRMLEKAAHTTILPFLPPHREKALKEKSITYTTTTTTTAVGLQAGFKKKFIA